MKSLTELLRAHIVLLLDQDPFFSAKWRALSRLQRTKFLHIALAIVHSCHATELETSFRDASEVARRLFVTVQEMNLLHTKIPSDWPMFVLEDANRRELFNSAHEELLLLTQALAPRSKVTLYGGLKDLGSIDETRISKKTESSIQASLMDTWDAVRFRAVFPTLRSVESFSVGIWRTKIDNIIRCRNYYFTPKGGDSQHPYRAIHFQIAHSSGYPYELQVMTQAAEVASYLEHPVRFKRRITVSNPKHDEWLNRICRSALVYDVQQSRTPIGVAGRLKASFGRRSVLAPTEN